MTDRLMASASVDTTTPDRYAKQLASHLGRRCELREAAGGLIFNRPRDCSRSARAELPSAAADRLQR